MNSSHPWDGQIPHANIDSRGLWYRRLPSLSFSACCNPSRVCLASGTRDAKGVGFDCVHPFQPFLELCRDERESVAISEPRDSPKSPLHPSPSCLTIFTTLSANC